MGLLFTSPHAVLAGWIHYLAFDLFVGAWEVRDARRHGLSHWMVVPCLALTLMLGPFGLLINAGLLWLTDKLIDDFEIPSIGMTVLMALLLTVGKFVLRLLL